MVFNKRFRFKVFMCHIFLILPVFLMGSVIPRMSKDSYFLCSYRMRNTIILKESHKILHVGFRAKDLRIFEFVMNLHLRVFFTLKNIQKCQIPRNSFGSWVSILPLSLLLAELTFLGSIQGRMKGEKEKLTDM